MTQLSHASPSMLPLPLAGEGWGEGKSAASNTFVQIQHIG